ncbi:hypothetical protein ROLI_018350 [Roseobacter fucihabitans]|uniref:Uncharacterized protein n=1 Tax=Roseobacter fucihabitans TaxID=1537242 RepID=A0ABZ2BRX0_9RHOB|nr:hypothetical protein [Roseobacter litoralis]
MLNLAQADGAFSKADLHEIARFHRSDRGAIVRWLTLILAPIACFRL